MITKTFNLTLDTKRGVIESPIIVVKGDTGNVFALRIQDNGADVDLTGCTVVVAFRGAGGCWTQDTSTGGVSVSGATVTLPLCRGSVSEGTNSCDVQIYSADENGDLYLITTAAFTFECRPSTINDDAIEADPTMPIVLMLLQQIHDAEERFPHAVVEDIPGGHRLTVTGAGGSVTMCDVMDGNSGVYVGSGDMPAGCNVQIDPAGNAVTPLPEPAQEGAAGQVLTTDGAGGRTWSDVDMSGKVSEPAAEGLSGQVLKTDGAGGRYWATETSGVTDYDLLSGRPQINSLTLTGDKSAADLSLAAASHTHTVSDVTDFPADVSAFTNDAGYLTGCFTTLWNNASPTSSFAGQTLSLDLSAYTGFIVNFRYSTNNSGRASFAVIKAAGSQACLMRASSSADTLLRTVSVTGSGITFSDGYSGTSTSNSSMIPVFVYGIV